MRLRLLLPETNNAPVAMFSSRALTEAASKLIPQARPVMSIADKKSSRSRSKQQPQPFEPVAGQLDPDMRQWLDGFHRPGTALGVRA
jgi:hypothetical protein